jgi:hypothetical protein
MVFLLGVMLYITRPGLFPPGSRMRPPEEGLRSPYEQPVTPRRGEAAPRAGEGMVRPGSPGWTPAGLLPEAPPLEEVRSAAARVYRLDVAGKDPTPIYLVVDETIDF